MSAKESAAGAGWLASLLEPATVAVIGASPNEAGHSGRVLANLKRTGFRGRVFPVNPKYETVGGLRCYASVTDIEDEVDSAYVLLPARRVADAVGQCVERGIGTVIVCTSGFGELGDEGVREQRRLTDLVRGSRTRLLGPNCIGVINVVDGYIGCPTFNITYRHTPGGVSFLSHSGGMASILFNRAQGRGVGVHAVVSLGNEADLEIAECVNALVDDEKTSVIGLFVEQLRDGGGFVEAAERARAAGKPIVALKAGRSSVGSRSVYGHTGALAGEHRVFNAVMRQLGVLEVTSVDELVDTSALLASGLRTGGPRLGVMSPSGGEGSYVADAASERGLVLPELRAETRQALAELMQFGNPANPLDPTGAIIGDPQLLQKVLAIFGSDPGFDMVHFAIPAWGAYDAEALLPAFVAAAKAAERPAVISMWAASDLTERADELLRSSGVPVFESSDAAVAAQANLYRFSTLGGGQQEKPPGLIETEPGAVGDVSEYEATQMLAAAGLPVAREALVSTAFEVADVAEALAGPVVVKLLARGVVHKSDLGLVRLGLDTPDAAASAASQLQRRAEESGLETTGFLVAEQVFGLEVIVGGSRDTTFGPMAVIGAGGVLTEYFDDVTLLRCPVAPTEVEEAIRGLRVHSLLAGARGQSYDVGALVELVSRFTRIFAGSPWLEEVDLNPVIVRPAESGGAYIVDAVIRSASSRRPESA